jgi:transaldolase
MTILHDTFRLGQQIWLDNLSRSLLEEGTLAGLIELGLAGVTTNPAIFAQALQDPVYAPTLARLRKDYSDPESLFETLAVADVSAACDQFLPLYQRTQGRAGMVSLEVPPALADDLHASLNVAARLWERVNRPNLMIKLPATPAGIAAQSKLLARGFNINMTLIFGRRQLQAVLNACATGLAERQREGKAVEGLRCVASVFLSRIDSAVDPA